MSVIDCTHNYSSDMESYMHESGGPMIQITGICGGYIKVNLDSSLHENITESIIDDETIEQKNISGFTYLLLMWLLLLDILKWQ